MNQTRREFLVAAAATVALGRTAGADEPRRLKKAVKFGMVKTGGSVRDRFAVVKRLGFDGIELPGPSPLDPDAVLRARDETGLPVHGIVGSLHWKHPLSHANPVRRALGRAALETALKDCKRYGGSTVLLVPGVVNADTPYDAAWERSTAEIRKVLPLAVDLGVKIAFENVWNHFLLSPLEAKRYVDQFQSPAVGWYLDVGNVVNYGWPEQWAKILGRRVLKLDVKEYSRKRRDAEGPWKGFGVEIGDGDCGWPAVMKALDAAGFDGWATAEVRGGDEARLADIAARMDRVLVYR